MIEAKSAALARNWWAVGLRGVAGMIVGFVALTTPGAALLTLAWLLGVYLVVDGIFAVIGAVRAAEHHERWSLLLGEGVLNLVMGGIVWYFPAGAVLAIVLILAGWALITGGLMLVSSFKLHGGHGRLWLALGGVVSLIWGVLLASAPFSGAVVLTWWFGVYALVFGFMMLVLALQLRRRHQTRAV